MPSINLRENAVRKSIITSSDGHLPLHQVTHKKIIPDDVFLCALKNSRRPLAISSPFPMIVRHPHPHPHPPSHGVSMFLWRFFFKKKKKRKEKKKGFSSQNKVKKKKKKNPICILLPSHPCIYRFYSLFWIYILYIPFILHLIFKF